MDRITKSLLDGFVQDHNLLLPEETAFEHFCGFLVTSKHHSESFSTEDVAVGEGGDCGMDCITIIVNGCLVTEPEEIADLSETNGYLEAVLVFTQAERSSSFEAAKIGQFGYGVVDFLSETPNLPQNTAVAEKCHVVNELFRMSGRFSRGNPQCHLYYVTTGRWTDDDNLVARRDSVA